MTRAITAGELVKLRAEGQWSLVYLLIDAPDTIYTARATGAVDEDDWTIGFDGGSGTLGNCLADMTLLIGSTAGASDVGIARLRKAPIAGTFYIGVDQSIEVADNDYLTVLNDFGLFAKHPIQHTIDVDVTYTDQFTSPIPVPMVDGRIRVLDEGETASFDASSSWIPGGGALTYSWSFVGATSTTGTATATPTATYNTSGRYRWILTVTGGGKTALAYGWIYVIGSNLSPEDAISFGTIQGDEDGWSTVITMYDTPSIRDGARAVIYSKDYYNGTQQNLGPVESAENIIMVGWIIGETIVRDPTKDVVKFEIGGPLVVLSNIGTKACGIQNSSFPSTDPLTKWQTMSGLTVARMLHYLINYRSTIAKVVDVYVEDWEYAVHNLTSEEPSILGQLNDAAGNAALAVSSDRLGCIYIMRDGQLYPMASRTANIPSVMTITDADWQEEFTLERRHEGGICQATAEGYIFLNKKITKVGGISPGKQKARFGNEEGLNELNVSAQADVLELSGLLAGSQNGEYEGGTVTLAQNNRFIDVAPRQFVTVTQGTDTVRCFPRRVSHPISDHIGFMMTELDLEAEGVEWPSVVITYPEDGEPPVIPPPMDAPPPEPPWPPEEPPEEPGDLDAVVATSSDIRTTGDLDVASPTWTTEL